jgi:hypothetical protein
MGSAPTPPYPLDASAHHHAYLLADADEPWHGWSIGRWLASFASVKLTSLAESANAASVWLAIRRGTTSVMSAAEVDSAIGLELTVELPDAARTNLATLTKPLIDGTIAAFHTHDERASIDIVAERLEAQTGVPAAEVRRLLDRNEAAILGPRRLLWPWRDGVQWNPADDRCAAFRIRRVARAAGSRENHAIRVRGSIFELAPRSL